MIYTVTTTSKEINLHPSTVVEEILQNVYTILTTVQFSVPLDRHLGIDGSYVDEPILIAEAKLATDVIEKVQRYEDRVSVEEVKFNKDHDDGRLDPIVIIKIKEGVL